VKGGHRKARWKLSMGKRKVGSRGLTMKAPPVQNDGSCRRKKGKKDKKDTNGGKSNFSVQTWWNDAGPWLLREKGKDSDARKIWVTQG